MKRRDFALSVPGHQRIGRTGTFVRRQRSTICLTCFCAMAVSLIQPGAAWADNWWTTRHGLDRNPVSQVQLTLDQMRTAWVDEAPAPPTPAWYGPAKWDAYAELPNLRSMRDYDAVDHTTLVDGRVYVGSTTCEDVRCLDAQTGELLWRFVTDGPVRIAPTVRDNRVWFGSDDGHAYCLEAETGKLVWRFAPVKAERKVLNDGRFISCWPIRTGVAVEDGLAYFAASLLPWKPTYLCAVDAESGSVDADGCFVQAMENQTLEGPWAVTEKLLIAPQGRVAPLVFAKQDGRLLGELSGGGGSFVVVTPEQNVLLGSDAQKNQWMVRSNPSSREQEKVASFQDANALAVVGQRTFLLSAGELIASDSGQEQPVWKVPSPGALTLVAASDVILVGGVDRVEAYAGDSGESLWHQRVQGRVLGISVADGIVTASTDTGRIYGFRWDEAGVPPSQAPESAAPLPDPVVRTPVPPSQISIDAAPAGMFARSPWMEFSRPGTVVIRWRTPQPVPTRLVWRTIDEQESRQESTPTTDHEVTIDGLQPHRIHQFRIEVVKDGENLHSPWYECDTFFNYAPPVLPPLDDPMAARTAEYILDQSEADRGLGLVFGIEDGRLAYQLAAQSRLRIIGFSTDAQKVAQARRWLREHAAYGTRVGIYLVESYDQLQVTPHCANLIVSETVLRGEVEATLVRQLRRYLAPGGWAMLGMWPEGLSAQRRQAVASALSSGEVVEDQVGLWRRWRGAVFGGAGDWSHIYGRADNSALRWRSVG